MTPADKPAQKASKARQTTRKGASAKSSKPAKPKCATADNVGVSEALNQEVAAAEEKSSSSEVASPATLNNSLSTTKTTPEVTPIQLPQELTPVEPVSSPLSKKSRKGRANPVKKPVTKPAPKSPKSKVAKPKVAKPRGIQNPGNLCYANSLFQCIEQHFPDDYLQSLAEIPLPIAGVSKTLQALPAMTRTEAGKARKTIKTALDMIDQEEICLGPWLNDFLKRLRQEGNTGKSSDHVDSEHLMAICGRLYPMYSGDTQEDSAEFMDWMMGELSKEWYARNEDDFPLERVFQGYRMQDVSPLTFIHLCECVNQKHSKLNVIVDTLRTTQSYHSGRFASKYLTWKSLFSLPIFYKGCRILSQTLH